MRSHGERLRRMSRNLRTLNAHWQWQANRRRRQHATMAETIWCENAQLYTSMFSRSFCVVAWHPERRLAGEDEGCKRRWKGAAAQAQSEKAAPISLKYTHEYPRESRNTPVSARFQSPTPEAESTCATPFATGTKCFPSLKALPSGLWYLPLCFHYNNGREQCRGHPICTAQYSD
jgi:hypothetical protein